ncbi:MAG: hypothetical protein U9Q34_04780 [Elusimicrobiota bacterium]|nr:hypothetical protein [Elusimicrobiota bacterium]
MTFDIYSLWIDPVFYISAAIFVLFLLLLVYSVRKYMQAEQPVNDGQQVTDEEEEEIEGSIDTEVLQEQEMEESLNQAESEEIPQEEGFETEMPVEQPVTSQSQEEQEQAQEIEAPVEEEAFEKTVIAQSSELPAVESSQPVEVPQENMVEEAPVLQEPSPQAPSADLSEAEGFVKGIFTGISDIDERLKAVESTLSERKLNGDFALRYLEDILDEYDAMDKTAVKSRIEYLIADLKK